MANREDNLKKRKPFKKNDPRINRNGRPVILVKQVVLELQKEGRERVSNADIIAVYEMLIGLTVEELTGIAKDESQPIIVRICAKSLLSPKGFEIAERMIDRAQGKVTQRIEVEESKKISLHIETPKPQTDEDNV